MKKYLLLIVVLLMGACSYDEVGYVTITGAETLTKMENGEDFVLMISDDDCYSCEMLKKESNKTIENNELTIYELYSKDVHDKVKEKLDVILGSYSSLPTLVKVIDGNVSVMNKYEYSQDPEGWKIWMKDMKLIKE